MSDPVAVYVHFPYCLQKCPYCDFASTGIKRAEVPHRAYSDAVLSELRRRRPEHTGEPLCSVFFGGGTPSLWDPDQLARVLAAICASFGTRPQDVEVTVECNPTSLDRSVAARLRDCGVNRLSIGVQSLDEARLRFLGRLHSPQGALEAIEAARTQFERVSADLIFGVHGQTPAQAAAEAARLAELGLSHISAYALTIEEGTQFGALHRKGRLPLALDDDVADAFLAVEEALTSRGLAHYEVSNYARPSEQARHNQHYWCGGEYLALGCGAVGCLRTSATARRRYRNDPNPQAYLAASADAAVEVFEEHLSAHDLVRERLMLGLRTTEGMDLSAARRACGVDPLAGREREVEAAVARGDLLRSDDVLRIPQSRWLGLDSIVAALF